MKNLRSLLENDTGYTPWLMNFAGPILVIAGLLVTTSAPSQDTNLPDGPYASIVARNMFGLVPIPPVDPHAGDPPPDPPPKITPTGHMTLFGREQALFKVAYMARPGQPAKDESYVLSEGERQDDIEVVKIDPVDGVITFNNNGTIQELPLAPSKDSGSGGGPSGRPFSFPGAPDGLPGLPAVAVPQHGIFPRPNITRNSFGSPGPGNGYGNGMINPGGGMGNPNSRGAFGSTPSGGAQGNPNGGNQPEGDQNLSPEQQVILWEAQRMKYLQENNGAPNP
jgi:hypothetical protein